MRTDSAEGDGLGAKEHEVVAVLHARDDAIAVEVFADGFAEAFIVSFGELHSASIVFT